MKLKNKNGGRPDSSQPTPSTKGRLSTSAAAARRVLFGVPLQASAGVFFFNDAAAVLITAPDGGRRSEAPYRRRHISTKAPPEQSDSFFSPPL